MAVKVHCSICDKFMKNIDSKDLGGLSGQEICIACGDKIDVLFSELEKGVAKFKKELGELHVEMNEKYATLKKSRDRFEADVNSLYSSMSAELKRRKEDLLR